MNLMDLMTGGSTSVEDAGRIYGVVVGVVTNNKDPDKMGRVKVKLPWLSDSEESDWARVASPMAGKSRGAFYLPEVDDEVLVAFEHGDARVPYVLGALWNGKDSPPVDNADGKNDKRVFYSRAGHKLVFDDNAQQGQVLIKTKAGNQVLLDDASGGEKITIQDKTGNKIVLDSSAITIEAQMSLSIKATNIELKANGQMTVDGGSMLTLKGGMVKIN
jgi:uncharacterized protein involved in type VI secretion and phage assembly